MPSDTKLSPNFCLSEFTISGVAERRGIRNVPNIEQVANLKRLAQILEIVRSNLGGVPVVISSGFRNPQVNAAVGGARNSAHLDGRAADFTAPRFGGPRAICEHLITSGVVFDQLIFEGSWVHLGISIFNEQPRQQVLTAIFERGQPVRYLKGIA